MEEEQLLEEQVNKEINAPKKSVKKNYFYNLIYQIFMVIVPLVVTPYVSRVLTKSEVGKYSFAYSLITYFLIFGALGFGYYAQRLVAKYQNDKYNQAKAFWETNICRLLPVGIALAVNSIVCAFKLYGDYNVLMWIFNIQIVATGLDIAFYFQGNEEFGKIVIRNIFIKTLSIIAIFVFVKDQKDLNIYTLIMSLTLIISNISLWMYVPKMIGKVKIKDLKPLSHLKGTFVLFIPTIAISIYTVLDKTLIGFIVKGTTELIEDGIPVIKKNSDIENGYYEQSEKIVKMIMLVITSIGTVMIPRNTHEIELGNDEKVKDNLKLSTRLALLISGLLVTGVIVLAPWFVPWFFGPGYDKCVILMQVLAPLILFIGLSNVFGAQCLVPYGDDKKFSIALLTGAIINLVLNLFFIRMWKSLGAAIATVIAEAVIATLMGIMVRKKVNFIDVFVKSWRYFVAAAVMFVSIYFIGNKFLPDHSFVNTLILGVMGSTVYVLMLLILVDPLIFKYLKMIMSKILRKKTKEV